MERLSHSYQEGTRTTTYYNIIVTPDTSNDDLHVVILFNIVFPETYKVDTNVVLLNIDVDGAFILLLITLNWLIMDLKYLILLLMLHLNDSLIILNSG